MSADRLAAALSDRYRIERELGSGGMAASLAGKPAARPMSVNRHQVSPASRFSDTSRAVASATSNA